MFDLAQTAVLRVYADVPQDNIGTSIDGTSACLEVSQIPGSCLPGTVARNAGAINAVTRTLRIEVDVPNASGAVLPGSYGQVRLSVKAAQPGLSLPVNTLLYRPEGLQVATVDAQHKVLLKTIKAGRFSVSLNMLRSSPNLAFISAVRVMFTSKLTCLPGVGMRRNVRSASSRLSVDMAWRVFPST